MLAGDLSALAPLGFLLLFVAKPYSRHPVCQVTFKLQTSI